MSTVAFNKCFQRVEPLRVEKNSITIEKCSVCEQMSFKRRIRIGHELNWYCLRCHPTIRPTLRTLDECPPSSLTVDTSPNHQEDSVRDSVV